MSRVPTVAFAPPFPDALDWLRQADGLTQAQIVDALQRDQLDRWQRRERVPAEVYLRFLASVRPASDEHALDLIYAEFLLRTQQGESPTVEEFRWRFPQFAEQLQMLVELEQQLRQTTPSQQEPTSHLLPQVAGYELLAEVGRGGMGIVYKALQERLDRVVALKLLPEGDMEARTRFRVEAEAVALLQHPNIVHIYETGEADDGCPYMALEFVDGGTLAQRLALGPLRPRDAAELIETLARAVHFAHQRGILHRDLKPANVLLSDDRRRETGVSSELPSLSPKISDFGLAKRLEERDSGQTRTGAILGTPAYMAPEQAEGRSRDVGVPTDVHALGAILYETLTGRPPFQGQTQIETMEQVRTREPIPPSQTRPNVPRDLETICMKCLRKSPSDRYPSAEALADDVRRFLHGESIHARRVGLAGRLTRWCRRNPAIAITLAIALVTTASVLAIGYIRVAQERDRNREARDEAVAHLYQSLVSEARALRLARAPGYRAEALARLDQAYRLDTPARNLDELRQEAVTCLGDFVGLQPAAWRDFPEKQYVVAPAVSPDGDEVALGTTDGVIRFRTRATGVETAVLEGHAAGVFAVAYGPDRSVFASADEKGTVKLWKRGPNGWAATRTLTVAPSGRLGYVHAVSLAFAPDGRRLYVCPRLSNVVTVWNVETGATEQDIQAPAKEKIYRMALSRDGKRLALALAPNAGAGVLVWDIAARKVLGRATPGLGIVNDVVFSPGGRHLACACEDGVAVYDGPELRTRLTVRGDVPNAVAFSPDEHLLAIPALEFGIVRLWDIRANREVALLRHAGEPHSIAFTADGSALVAVGAQLVHVWNLHGTGEKIPLPGHDSKVVMIDMSADGRRLFSSGHGVVQIADPRTGQPLGRLTGFAGAAYLAVSADGRTLFTCDDLGTAQTWDVTDPTAPVRRQTYQHTLGTSVWNVGMSPDEKHLVAVGDLGLTLWTIGDPRGTLLDNRGTYSCSFSADGRFLLWNSKAGEVILRDLTQGTQTKCVVADKVRGMWTLLPDGQRVVRVNADGGHEVLILDAHNGNQLGTLGRVEFGEQSSFFMARSATVSRDGKRVAVEAPTIPVWDLEQRRRLFALPREHSLPTTVRWGAGHELLAVGSRDGGLVVWNMPALRKQLAQLGLDWDD